MPDVNIDSWITQGGLDDEWVTFRNVEFKTDIEYRDGEVPFLSVDLIPDDPEVGAREGQRFGCGAGWDVVDDGAGIDRTDGKRPQFHANSKMGALVASFLEAGGREHVEARHKAGDQTTPFLADFYEGLHARIVSNTAEGEGDEGKFTWDFYTIAETDGYESGSGDSGEAKPAKKAASKKAAAKKAPTKKRAAKKAAEEDGDEGSDLRERLVEHCNSSDAETHDDWMMEAYEAFPDDVDSGEFQQLVDNPDEVWAEVVD